MEVPCFKGNTASILKAYAAMGKGKKNRKNKKLYGQGLLKSKHLND